MLRGSCLYVCPCWQLHRASPLCGIAKSAVLPASVMCLDAEFYILFLLEFYFSLVQELRSRQDLERFVRAQPDNVLTVVNVSSNETPCVRVFAAVLALAKSFQGYAAFGRLMYGESQEARDIAKELNVLQVRRFLAGEHAQCTTCMQHSMSCP